VTTWRETGLSPVGTRDPTVWPIRSAIGTMTGVEPREIVDIYLDIIRTGEFDRLDEMLSPDIYDHVGQRRGIAWWKEILGSLSGGFSDRHVVVHHVLVDGDMVAVHLTVEGVHTGRFLPQIGPVEPTGKPFAWSHVHLFRVADGLAVEHWAVRDDIGLAKQVGIL
jgi:predicted ester cyclase